MSEYNELLQELDFCAVYHPGALAAIKAASKAIQAQAATIQSLQARVKELEADADRWRAFQENRSHGTVHFKNGGRLNADEPVSEWNHEIDVLADQGRQP